MKEKILKLREEGKSYSEIIAIVGCARSTVSYHCGEGQKEKTRERYKKFSAGKPFIKNIDNFKYRARPNSKLRDFGRMQKGFKRGLAPTSNLNFTHEDVYLKIGDNPSCYLTGDPIDLSEPKTYAFDHIHPASKGGENSLENLGFCTKTANMSKTDMTLEEYISHCKKVLENFGYKVSK